MLGKSCPFAFTRLVIQDSSKGQTGAREHALATLHHEVDRSERKIRDCLVAIVRQQWPVVVLLVVPKVVWYSRGCKWNVCVDGTDKWFTFWIGSLAFYKSVDGCFLHTFLSSVCFCTLVSDLVPPSLFLCVAFYCLIQHIYWILGWLTMCTARTVGDINLCLGWLRTRARRRLEVSWCANPGSHVKAEASEKISWSYPPAQAA